MRVPTRSRLVAMRCQCARTAPGCSPKGELNGRGGPDPGRRDSIEELEIENWQPLERIELVVKPAIDSVAAMGDPDLLAAYADDADNPPEARLFAAAKVEVELEIATAERRLRPVTTLERLRASTAGLGFNDGVIRPATVLCSTTAASSVSSRSTICRVSRRCPMPKPYWPGSMR